ncbi:MAG: polysaccharide biosynthesis tyrosine autokinase [Parvibaculum sp.]|nr:polysaccharide biosynthesis tyrosine autokinase [Parvibaculum sp.]
MTELTKGLSVRKDELGIESNPDESSILAFDGLAILRALRRRLQLIVMIAVVGTAIALAVILQLTPLYTAQSLVFIDRHGAQVVDFESVMSGISGDAASVESEVEIIQSRTVMRRVVDKLDLTQDPEFNSSLRPASFFKFTPLKWAKSLLGESSTEELDESERQTRLVNAVIDAVVARTKVARRGGTYVIELNFTSNDAAKSALVVNAIADAYVLDQLEVKFEATKQASEWLSQRLEGLRQQVEDSERASAVFRAAHGLESALGTTLNDQQLSELNAQLILARANLAEKEAIATRARQIRASGGSIESVAGVLQSATISALRQKQAELARQEADLSSKYGPRHPSIVNIDAQRRDLDRQIGNEVSRIMGSISNEVAVAQSRVDALFKNLDQLRGRSGDDNQASVQLRELERVATANRSVYETFLNRYGETSTIKDLQTADARVITRATRPASPSFPRVPMLATLAFLASIGLGVAIALLAEQLDNGLRTATDVEQFLKIACLGSVPSIASRGKGFAKDYVLEKPLSVFTESLRSLRSALALSNVDNPPKIILFTSALPSEGKTSTAVSFSVCAAQAGLRTLLIDCDLRHPSVYRNFSTAAATVGLVELLARTATLEETVIKDLPSGLEILPVAAGTLNPADLLGSVQMQKLLEGLRTVYDLIILDSAPILPVSDTRVLSRVADKTVFVVRWTNTPRVAAHNAIKLLRYYDANLAGALLTVVDMSKQAKYGYGDGGYYYGKYNSYYVN